MKKISIKKKISFFFIFFFLIIIIIEIFLRLISIEYPIFQKHDPIRGFSLLPNSKGIWTREGRGEVKINSMGLRDYEHTIDKPSDILRIAILGDSYAEARSVNLEETFWFKLGKNLKNCKSFHKGKKIEVINFGVSEYGTTQQYLTLKNHVWKYNPDIILLAFYSGNDISDNLKILSTKKYRPYFEFEGDKIKSIDKDYLKSKPYEILSSYYGQLFIKLSQYSRIAQLFRESYVQMYFASKRKSNLNLNKKANKSEANLYNPNDEPWAKAWIVTEKIIKLIDKDVREKNKDFILVSLSNPIQVYPSITYLKDYKKKNNIDNIFYPENRLAKFSKKNKIKVLSISQIMRKEALEKKIFFHGFYNTKLGTGHWNETGHDFASKLISKGICKLY